MAKFTFMLILVIDLYLWVYNIFFFCDIYPCQLFVIIMFVKVPVSY